MRWAPGFAGFPFVAVGDAGIFAFEVAIAGVLGLDSLTCLHHSELCSSMQCGEASVVQATVVSQTPLRLATSGQVPDIPLHIAIQQRDSDPRADDGSLWLEASISLPQLLDRVTLGQQCEVDLVLRPTPRPGSPAKVRLMCLVNGRHGSKPHQSMPTESSARHQLRPSARRQDLRHSPQDSQRIAENLASASPPQHLPPKGHGGQEPLDSWATLPPGTPGGRPERPCGFAELPPPPGQGPAPPPEAGAAWALPNPGGYVNGHTVAALLVDLEKQCTGVNAAAWARTLCAADGPGDEDELAACRLTFAERAQKGSPPKDAPSIPSPTGVL